MVPSLYQTIYAFLLLVMARKKEQMSHLNRTQSLSPPCSDQEMITSYVPTPSPCKEDRANESPIQDPITLSSMLRPGNDQYSRVSHNIQFERSYSWSKLGRKSNVSHNKTQSLPPPCFDQEIITSYGPIPSPCKEGRATGSSKTRPNHSAHRAQTRKDQYSQVSQGIN